MNREVFGLWVHGVGADSVFSTAQRFDTMAEARAWADQAGAQITNVYVTAERKGHPDDLAAYRAKWDRINADHRKMLKTKLESIGRQMEDLLARREGIERAIRSQQDRS